MNSPTGGVGRLAIFREAARPHTISNTQCISINGVLGQTVAMYKLAVELALRLSPLAFGQSAAAGPPEIVEFTSSNLPLKGYLWKPPGRGPFPAVLFNHGSGGADAMHTAGMSMGDAAQVLAAVFVKHGYAFFFPCRRGHGLSADQAEFMQDALKKQEVSGGIEARN